MNKIYILLFFLFSVFLFSCNKPNSIYGKWEDSNRILEFSEYGDFTLEFKNSNLVKGYRGRALKKKNIMILFFEEFKDSNNEWLYTDGTDLEDYKEILFISFEDEKLVTQIKSTNKKFIYTKIID